MIGSYLFVGALRRLFRSKHNEHAVKPTATVADQLSSGIESLKANTPSKEPDFMGVWIDDIMEQGCAGANRKQQDT